jgi:hypothetical protein
VLALLLPAGMLGLRGALLAARLLACLRHGAIRCLGALCVLGAGTALLAHLARATALLPGAFLCVAGVALLCDCLRGRGIVLLCGCLCRRGVRRRAFLRYRLLPGRARRLGGLRLASFGLGARATLGLGFRFLAGLPGGGLGVINWIHDSISWFC